ncbi:MAG: hypothetical protein O3A10_06530 [Chloroflexi bacterium]|nr:hypothetical protein [Chloroflexota bacterium]MDA1145021.1 hypothetical protein [Chloroflexota bacterium]MQC82906.1 hypothetical protein [Chloroflexota bacterium]
MFRRSRNLILILLAAAAGAMIGRWVAEARSRIDAGEDPLAVDLHDLQIRPQDFIPGVVAAFRVGEPPWSWLHIPNWVAAFGTNFAAAAVGGDLDRLRQMAEDRAMSALGLDRDTEIEIEDIPQPAESHSSPFGAPQPPPPSPPRPAAAPPPPPPSATQPVWTRENATPPPTNGNGNGAPHATETPGFTPLSD